MISLKHITEEDLRRYYYLEGQISGKAKNINILNGINQDYVGARMNDFIIWNDEWNKSKFELYIKENLPNMEIKYIDIVKTHDEIVKKKEEEERTKKNVLKYLTHPPIDDRRKKILDKKKKAGEIVGYARVLDESVVDGVLNKYGISKYEYDQYKNLEFYNRMQSRQRKKEINIKSEINTICNDITKPASFVYGNREVDSPDSNLVSNTLSSDLRSQCLPPELQRSSSISESSIIPSPESLQLSPIHIITKTK